jgi:hypothetical protein
MCPFKVCLNIRRISTFLISYVKENVENLKIELVEMGNNQCLEFYLWPKCCCSSSQAMCLITVLKSHYLCMLVGETNHVSMNNNVMPASIHYDVIIL